MECWKWILTKGLWNRARLSAKLVLLLVRAPCNNRGLCLFVVFVPAFCHTAPQSSIYETVAEALQRLLRNDNKPSIWQLFNFVSVFERNNADSRCTNTRVVNICLIWSRVVTQSPVRACTLLLCLAWCLWGFVHSNKGPSVVFQACRHLSRPNCKPLFSRASPTLLSEQHSCGSWRSSIQRSWCVVLFRILHRTGTTRWLVPGLLVLFS